MGKAEEPEMKRPEFLSIKLILFEIFGFGYSPMRQTGIS